LAAAAGRPFQLERVGSQARGVEIAFEREDGHDLAPGLHEVAERQAFALRARAGLLFEFALRHGERILGFGIFSLRDRPRAGILLGPERAAGVHEQNLEPGIAPPIEENSGTALGHFSAARAAAHKRLWRAIARVTSSGTAASAVARSACRPRAAR